MREMDDMCLRMKEAVRVASVSAVGMASEPPGWKSFWTSIRSSVVILLLVDIGEKSS